jgi:glyoxylate reductase
VTKPRVYITRTIPQAAVDIIASDLDYEMYPSDTEAAPRTLLLEKLRDVDGAYVLLTDRVDAEFFAAGPRLKVVSLMAVGYDNISVPAATAAGVMVTNTPGVLTETTADLTWALLMAAARRIVEGQKLIEAGQWLTWSPMFMVGQEVHGAALGIVGAGRIGSAVARRAKGFNMRIRYYNRRRNEELERETGAEYRPFDDLLRESDFVVCLVPLNDETRGLFGYEQFRLMKRTAVFVNASRGPVVKELELVRALEDRLIWGAGIDVFEKEPIGADHPLLRFPHCVCIPHLGSSTIATRTRMATLAAENLVAALTGRRPPNLVNPEVLAR